MTQRIYDRNESKINLFIKPSHALSESLDNYFLDAIKNGHSVNRITIEIRNESPLSIQIGAVYNQEIVDNFEANLPKSKKGKIIAWYTTRPGN